MRTEEMELGSEELVLRLDHKWAEEIRIEKGHFT